MKSSNRREVLKTLTKATVLIPLGSLLPAVARSDEMPKLKLDDPQAVALGYIHVSEIEDQICEGCQLYVAGDDAEWGMRLGSAEMLLAGVTTTCEMYLHEEAVVAMDEVVCTRGQELFCDMLAADVLSVVFEKGFFASSPTRRTRNASIDTDQKKI